MKNLKNNKGLIIGLIIGLAGGVTGNILVTSMYRAIDKNPIGFNWLTFAVSAIFFGIIIKLLFKNLKD